MDAYVDYVQWVNDNKMIAPCIPEKTIPANITFKLKWAMTLWIPAKA